MSRRALTLDEKILKQKEIVALAKERYETAEKELEELEAKREEQRNKQLLSVAAASGKTYDEIMAFLQGREVSCK